MNRYFYHILFFIIVISFVVGYIRAGAIVLTDKTEPNITTDYKPDAEIITDGLKDCSRVNTMPCTASPRNPLKEKLDSQVMNNTKLFKKNDYITCIYPLVQFTAWSDGTKEQYVKNVGLKCIVLKASEEYPDLEPNYQHLRVDCTKDMPKYNAVMEHKLNGVRWFSSTDCYHFTQAD